MIAVQCVMCILNAKRPQVPVKRNSRGYDYKLIYIRCASSCYRGGLSQGSVVVSNIPDLIFLTDIIVCY